jgi:4-diphosphocytidyl-2-C-methyl-D-erythritol kinase
MIVFPNAKINLGIRVLRKRSDGFHDLETIFYPIPLCDVLEITPFNEKAALIGAEFVSSTVQVGLQSGGFFIWSCSGNTIEGDINSNLCVRAFRLFDSVHPVRPHYYVHLHKVIPSGAGLGGGSSDASFLLKTLNQLEGSPLNNEKLAEMSLQLGSDCPFFIENSPALAFGRGEVLRKIHIDLKGYRLLLVKPPVHIATPEAFRNVKMSEPLFENSPDLMLDVQKWQTSLINSFEDHVFRNYPEVKAIKNKMLESGAVYASMSGSGSSVFGLFTETVRIDFSEEGYFVFESVL